MFSKWIRLFLLGVFLLSAVGCTTRAWYEGLREKQRQDCYRQTNDGGIERCLERVDAMTYDRYRAERTKGKSTVP